MWRSGIKGQEVFYQGGPWWVVGLYRKTEERYVKKWSSKTGVSYQGGPSLGVSLYKKWPTQLADIYIYNVSLATKRQEHSKHRGQSQMQLQTSTKSVFWFAQLLVWDGGGGSWLINKLIVHPKLNQAFPPSQFLHLTLELLGVRFSKTAFALHAGCTKTNKQ